MLHIFEDITKNLVPWVFMGLGIYIISPLWAAILGGLFMFSLSKVVMEVIFSEE